MTKKQLKKGGCNKISFHFGSAQQQLSRRRPSRRRRRRIFRQPSSYSEDSPVGMSTMDLRNLMGLTVSGEPSSAHHNHHSTNLALKPLSRKVENNNSWQSGSNEHSKPGNSQSGIPGTSEGGCLMARIKTVQRFLEHQPQARPGICTILVGLTLFTLGLLLSFLHQLQPHWAALSLVGIGLLVTFIGSLQLFLYFHNVNVKQRNQNNPVAAVENGKSAEDRRTDTIALSAAGRLEPDPESCDQAAANGDTLALPPHSNHKASVEGNYVTQAYKIFLRFRDPLVLRTPTVINFKCEYEFPDDGHHVVVTDSSSSIPHRSSDVTGTPSPTFADDMDDDVIRGGRRVEEGGVLRFSADEVEETRA